jgi:hypothetical protein
MFSTWSLGKLGVVPWRKSFREVMKFQEIFRKQFHEISSLEFHEIRFLQGQTIFSGRYKTPTP